MTLTSAAIKVQYDGTGAQTAFPVPFVFWDLDDILVIHTDASNIDTNWTRGTQYTVTGGDGAIGTVTVDTSPVDYTPAINERLTVLSNLDDEQLTSLPLGGPFPSTAVEQALDKIVRLLQQRAEETSRAVSLAESSAAAGVIIPDGVANNMLRWDATATFLENVTPTDSGVLVLPLGLTQGGTAGETAAEARTNLDVETARNLVLFNLAL